MPNRSMARGARQAPVCTRVIISASAVAYVCHPCGKSFPRPSKLRRHLLSIRHQVFASRFEATCTSEDCNVAQVQRAELSAESSAINSLNYLPEREILVSVTKYYIRKIDWHAVHVVCQFQAAIHYTSRLTIMRQELDVGTTTIHTDCNVVQMQRAEMSAEISTPCLNSKSW